MDYKKLIIEALQELDETRMKHIYYFIKGMKKNRKVLQCANTAGQNRNNQTHQKSWST